MKGAVKLQVHQDQMIGEDPKLYGQISPETRRYSRRRKNHLLQMTLKFLPIVDLSARGKIGKLTISAQNAPMIDSTIENMFAHIS